MLKWFGKQSYGCSNPCFCAALYWVTGEFSPDSLNNYPELIKYKPKGKRAYWFEVDKEGIEKRKNILRKIIKEMS